jgi:hypothetical protein
VRFGRSRRRVWLLGHRAIWPPEPRNQRELANAAAELRRMLEVAVATVDRFKRPAPGRIDSPS